MMKILAPSLPMLLLTLTVGAAAQDAPRIGGEDFRTQFAAISHRGTHARIPGELAEGEQERRGRGSGRVRRGWARPENRDLEAPDAAIQEAVRSALSKWLTAPLQVVGDKQQYENVSTLTFYFQIKDGRGPRVESRRDAGRPGLEETRRLFRPARSRGTGRRGRTPPARSESRRIRPLRSSPRSIRPSLMCATGRTSPAIIGTAPSTSRSRSFQSAAASNCRRPQRFSSTAPKNPQWFAVARSMLAMAGITKVVLLVP